MVKWSDRANLEEGSTPEEMLDALRKCPKLDSEEEEAFLDHLIEKFPMEAIVDAVRPRLSRLSGRDFEVLLRLVYANPNTDLPHVMAQSLEKKPNLSLSRMLDVLNLLQDAGILQEHPALVALWDELTGDLEGEGSVDDLLDLIELDSDGVWLALQGFARVEPEIRVQILAEIAQGVVGPGAVEFVRMLAYSDDPRTRQAALDALNVFGNLPDLPGLRQAWVDLATHHPDASVALFARERVQATELVPALALANDAGATALALTTPRLVRSMVTAVDGQGRALIGLGSERGGQPFSAIFSCDVVAGVLAVQGDDRTGNFEALAGPIDADLVENDHHLALALLAGCLTLNGPATPPVFRYWLEQTVGPNLRPRPFRAEFPDWDPTEVPFDEIAERTAEVLARCPDWLDNSPLTYELAEEIHLREKAPPDPKRDSGAYRFLFEHRLVHDLEPWRRMLLWMAWLWRSEGSERLSRSALVLAWQLSDAQHVVPGHPFTVQISTRSLAAAQENLKRGVDPRRTK
jgi:hypothetical protein